MGFFLPILFLVTKRLLPSLKFFHAHLRGRILYNEREKFSIPEKNRDMRFYT